MTPAEKHELRRALAEAVFQGPVPPPGAVFLDATGGLADFGLG